MGKGVLARNRQNNNAATGSIGPMPQSEYPAASQQECLAAVEPEAGTLVVYAAKDGETALDGDGTNSPFASAFVKNLPTPGLEVRRLFDLVRDDVMEATGRKQKPFSYGSTRVNEAFVSLGEDYLSIRKRPIWDE